MRSAPCRSALTIFAPRNEAAFACVGKPVSCSVASRAVSGVACGQGVEQGLRPEKAGRLQDGAVETRAVEPHAVKVCTLEVLACGRKGTGVGGERLPPLSPAPTPAASQVGPSQVARAQVCARAGQMAARVGRRRRSRGRLARRRGGRRREGRCRWRRRGQWWRRRWGQR